MQNIGIRISQYRQNRNLTQEELAVKIGVTSQAVSKWERGQSLPDIITFHSYVIFWMSVQMFYWKRIPISYPRIPMCILRII